MTGLMDEERAAEVGDDWAAEAAEESYTVHQNELLKEMLRAASKQIASLERQIRERDEVIRELQEMVIRLGGDLQ